MNGDGRTGVEIELKFFILAFIYFLFTPKISIDGSEPEPRKWGTHFFPAAPGPHRVRAFCPYLFMPTMGDSTTNVEVLQGQVARLKWSPPWLVFLSGTWKTIA